MDTCIENTLRGRKFKRILEKRTQVVREEFNLKQIDLDILFYVSNCKEKVAASEICRILSLNKGQVSTSLDRLRDSGYLCAERDDNDKRIWYYGCSDKADAPLKRLDEGSIELKQKIMKGITEEELKCVMPIVKKLYENMDRLIEDEE